MYRSYFSFVFFLDLPVVDMVSQANLFCKPYWESRSMPSIRWVRRHWSLIGIITLPVMERREIQLLLIDGDDYSFLLILRDCFEGWVWRGDFSSGGMISSLGLLFYAIYGWKRVRSFDYGFEMIIYVVSLYWISRILKATKMHSPAHSFLAVVSNKITLCFWQE